MRASNARSREPKSRQEVDPAKPLKLVKEIYKKAATIAFVPLNILEIRPASHRQFEQGT